MKQRTVPPLVVKLYRSRKLALFIHLLHLLLLTVLLVSGLKPGMQIAVFGVVTLSWLVSCFDHLWPLEPKRPLVLRLTPNGSWQLKLPRGGEYDLKLKGYTSFSALQIIHFFPQKSGPSSLFILPDSLTPSAHRQLRVWLNETESEDQKSLLGR